MPVDLPRMGRRGFLVGAGAAVLAACSGGSGDDEGGGELAAFQFVGGKVFVAGEPSRLPFGLADDEALLPLDQTPTSVRYEVRDDRGAVVASGEARRHHEGLPRPYYALLFTPPAVGTYTARVDAGSLGTTEMAVAAYAQNDVLVTRPGDRLPSVVTPTVADARGVTPICTRSPACPLHDVPLSTALTDGRPIALLVSTPAFCQVAVCGPVLDVLLSSTAGHPGVRFLHAEVYVDPRKGIESTKATEIVTALDLEFEPSLFLADRSGTVVQRLDSIFDADELGAALARLPG